MRSVNKIALYICLISTLISCGRNENKHLRDLSKNIIELESLRHYIETHHKAEVIDSLKMRFTFIISKDEIPRYESYVYDDEVIHRMKKLNIKEIHFEKKMNNLLDEVYFVREKLFSYPVVYYLYEYEGTTKFFESQTIYYKPVNKHWSLYIDSNFP